MEIISRFGSPRNEGACRPTAHHFPAGFLLQQLPRPSGEDGVEVFELADIDRRKGDADVVRAFGDPPTPCRFKRCCGTSRRRAP